ncbi:MAG: hypothetical protein R2695_12075 [Acidimicrobiales bacterium]
MITNLQRKWTRKGRPDGRVRARGSRGQRRGDGLPRTMQEHGPKLADDTIVMVRGRVENSEGPAEAVRPGHRGDRRPRRQHPGQGAPRPFGPTTPRSSI